MDEGDFVRIEIDDPQDGTSGAVLWTMIKADGERVPMHKVSTDDLGVLVSDMMRAADYFAESRMPGEGGGGGQAVSLSNVLVSAQSCDGNKSSALILDFGIVKFGVMQSTAELRRLARDALSVAERVEAMGG